VKIVEVKAKLISLEAAFGCLQIIAGNSHEATFTVMRSQTCLSLQMLHFCGLA